MGIIDRLLGTNSDEKGSSLSDEFEFSRVGSTHNRNNNNPNRGKDVFPYRPAPAASSALVNQHRRAHSDVKPMPSVARQSVLGDKSATLAAPTPRPTKVSLPKLDLSRNEALLDQALDATPTPGFEEAPFDFYRRRDVELTNKGASLPVGIPPPTSPLNLEQMLYNQDAHAPYSPSVAEDASLMDWEKLKKRLKTDQEMITKRISRSFSQSMEGDGSGIQADHFWYKPNFKRIHAEEALQGTPVGSFLVRKSSEQGSYALSVQTKELGLTHLLIKPAMGLWKLQGDTTAAKEFSSVPSLIDFYKDQPMPVKGISPFRLS